MKLGIRGWLLALLAAVCIWPACSTPNEPIVPTPTPTPTPTSTPVVNTPPVIRSVTVGLTRAEVDQDVQVVADVTDAETSPANLVYLWSAPVGTFSGTGSTVTWRLPAATLAETPLNVVISLTVSETYQGLTADGLVTKENRVTADAAPFRVHDSYREISRIGLSFLIDKFGNSLVSPEACLVDFSDSCRGKADELSDIKHNREAHLILGVTATVDSIAFNAPRSSATFATARVPCSFHDIELATGKEGFSPPGAICWLDAIYETQRWWLCNSGYTVPSNLGGDAISGRMNLTDFFKLRRIVR